MIFQPTENHSRLPKATVRQAVALTIATLFVTAVVLVAPTPVLAKKKQQVTTKQQGTVQVAKAKTSKKNVSQNSKQTVKAINGTRRQAPLAVAATPSPVVSPLAATMATAPVFAQSTARTKAQAFFTLLLTPEGKDAYTVVPSGGNGMIMSAPETNTGVNLRQLMWANTAAGKRQMLNAQTCATWTSESTDMLQQGLALRVFHNAKTGRTKAITLTKNTIFDVHWTMNILTWDSQRKGDPYKGLAQFNMADVLYDDTTQDMRPLPWRVCMRAVNDKLTLKVWFPNTMKEPSWTNKTYTRSVKIPRSYMVPGLAGWYIGHIPAGGSATYSDMSTKKL